VKQEIRKYLTQNGKDVSLNKVYDHAGDSRCVNRNT